MDPRAGPLHARTHHQTVRRWLHHGADSPADRELSRVPRRAHPRLRVLIRRSDDLRGGSQASGRQGFVPGPDAGSGSPRPDLGTDVLVAQGNEAGGHTGRLGTLPFLAQVLDIAGGTPVIAAGGIASGRAHAAVLAAGGEGAWLGTPLLATHEAIEVSDRYKKC